MYPPPHEPRRPLLRLPSCSSVLIVLVVIAAGVWLAIRSTVHWLTAHVWWILGAIGLACVTAGVVAGLSIANYLGRSSGAGPPGPPD